MEGNQFTTSIIKFSSLPAISVAIYTWIIYKKLPTELKVFSIFIFLSGLVEASSKALWFYSKNNLPLLHFYVAAGFVSLVWFYGALLSGFINERIIWGVAILFTIFTVLNSLFVQTIYTFNSYALTVESILIVIFSLSAYMLMMEDIVKRKREGLIQSLNWINSGLFIYYASSLLIFYYGDLFIRVFPKHFNMQTWVLHSCFLIVMYFCFFMGLWHRPQK